MPDATYGSIKMITFDDASKAGVQEVVTTTLHIEQKIGSLYVKDFGGIHKFFNWNRPILTDSGGWQVFSLINSGKGDKSNKISELGCSFIDPENGKHSLLTPESSITIQANLGSDIMTVLDNPILGNASLNDRKECVRINTNWAKRAKIKFDKLKSEGKIPVETLLGCVIQGADDFDLRKQSAEELLELDFDIYNFGGVPMVSEVTWLNGSPQGFYYEMLDYVCKLIPNEKYKYAMGVGQPDDIAYCVDVGWDLFDTVLPTRNARHGYLYVTKGLGDKPKGYISSEKVSYDYDVMHLRSERYKFDDSPVDLNCDCECCKSVSRAYLRHLIRINEPAGFRLATIHNLRFYSQWLQNLRISSSTSMKAR